jgi:glutathione S-transferase
MAFRQPSLYRCRQEQGTRMTLRIIGKASSINVRKVLWACEELGLACERSDEGPELAHNPNGLVPVIVDGDFVLWESNTILRYLAGRQGASALLPAEPRARAEVEKWIDWQATEFNTAWRYAFMSLARKHPAFDDTRQIEASSREWARMLGILDARLAETKAYVAGPVFTLADIPIGLSVNRWFLTPMQRPSFPAVEAYYERLSARPAFLKHGRNGIY